MLRLNRIGLLVLLCVAACPPTSHAQATREIDGSVHPEQITDLEAYRMVFHYLALSTNPTPEQLTLHKAKLARLALNDEDTRLLDQQLTGFEEQYAKCHSEAATPEDFHARRDTMVHGIVDALKRDVSPQGFKAIDGFVQREKSHMKISQ